MVNVFIKIATSLYFIEMGILLKEPYLIMIARVKTPKKNYVPKCRRDCCFSGHCLCFFYTYSCSLA